MASENKLLGVLQLKADGVLATIDQVNQKLKSLGEGVDLDLTKILNAKVNSQLENLKKQIDDVNRAATGRSAQQNQEIKEASKLIKEQIDLQTKLVGAQGQNQKDVLAQQISQRAKAISELDPKIREQAAATETATKAQERYNVAVAKAQDKEYAKRQSDLNQQLKQTDKDARQAAASFELMANRMTMIVGRFSLQLLREQWQGAVDYAMEYYDALNEIRVVTGMTEEASKKLGASFRQMAQAMSVTSTEIASAAVTFYRQGLNDAQVKSRLEWVTKYAKVASISFESAAELITASANAMSEDIQGDIQRVVDVFLYLGDNAATTGEEVGKAMQKASASATEFGVSFEWLGSWIATVAEQTRQAPETIGNAFNSMMARLHSIRSTGFNAEDEVNINQVAKALATVNVELMDQEGNWRNMTDIFNEVAEHWDSMTGKQKSYIATTVAGVRQQNVFFALMNDLSKGIENGSRAWELYTGALESAGTATEKYATWQESVAAAQANLSNSLEALYSKLSGNAIKTFYNFFAGFVDGLTRMGDSVIWIPIVAGITAVVLAIRSFYATLKQTTGFMATSAAVFNTHPLFMTATIIVGILGLVGAIGAFVNAIDPAVKAVENYNDATAGLADTSDRIAEIKSIQESVTRTFNKMQSGVELTDYEIIQYNNNLNKLAEISPRARYAVDDLKRGVDDQTTAFANLNAAIEETLKKYSEEEQHFAFSALQAYRVPVSLSSGSISAGYKRVQDLTGKSDEEDVLRGLLDYIYNTGWTKENVSGFAGEEFANAFYDSLNGFDPRYKKVTDQEWGRIQHDLWLNLFGGDNSNESLKQAMDSELNTLLSLAEQAVGGFANELQREAALQQWKSIITDNAGNLIDNAGVALYDAITRYDVHADRSHMVSERMLALIMTKIGLAFDFDNAYNQISQFRDYYSPELMENIISAWLSMVDAGFSEADIADMVQNYSNKTGLSIMEILAEQFQNAIWQAIADKMGGLDHFYYTEDWQADITSQKLMLDLLELGKTKADIDEIFSNSHSLEEFNEGLEGAKRAAKDAGEEFVDFAASMKNVANNLSYIDKIDALLKSINEDQTYDADDLLEIAKTNPEILAAAGSIDTLREGLEKLRNTKLDELRKQYSDLVSSIEDIDPDDVDAIVDALMNLQKPQTQTVSMTEQLKSLQDQLDDLQGIIDGLENGESLSVDDFLKISEMDETLFAYSSSFDQLIEGLKKKRQEVAEEQKALLRELVLSMSEEGQRSALRGYVLTNPEYMNSGKLSLIRDQYGVQTAQELLDLFNSKEYRQESGYSDATWERRISWVNECVDEIVESFINDLPEEYIDSLIDLFTRTKTPFEEFVESVEKLSKAQSALDVILHPEDKDTSALANAWKSLIEIFPNLKQDGTASVDDVKTEVDVLENSVRSTAEGFGDLGTGIIASMSEGVQAVRLLSEEMQNSFFATASQENIASYIEKNFASGSVDWMGQKRVSASKMQALGWDIGDSAYANKASVEYQRVVGNKNYEILATPILPDGTVLTPAALDSYIDEIATKANEMGITLLESDAVENGGKGLLYYIAEIGDSLDDARESATLFDAALSAALAAYANKSIATIAADINQDIQAARESLDGYKTVLDGMEEAYSSGFIDDVLVFFASLSDSTQSGFTSAYQELAIALGEVNSAIDEYNAIAARSVDTEEQAAEKTRELAEAENKIAEAEARYGKALKNAQATNSAKYFQNTAKAIQQLSLGTINAADAYTNLYTEAEKAVTAQSEFLTATHKMADGAEVASDDVKTLAEFLGYVTPDALLDNWDQVGSLLSDAINEGTEALNRLNEAAFINITGTSSADFSNVMNGLVAVQDAADETVQKLLATGQWELEEREVDNEFPLWLMGKGGKITFQKLHAAAKYRFLKPTGKNPFKGAASNYTGTNTSSGGGGGGGGGGSSSKGMTEVERMLDRMAQIQDIQDHVRSLYSAQAKLYEQTGQLQGAIKYYEKERTAIEQQNKTLQANIDEMEPWLEKKRAEVAALDVASSEYEEASSDLKALQERHQQYTLALINNTAEIDQLTEAIKEQHNAIRKMEIDLRNTILDAIKDREALNERMLEGTIKVEEEILELIKRRYEKERDMILENTEKQISALEKERDLLSEQLELRKQQAEEEDKAAKLSELEAKYARIVADPTRQKEALSIQKEIRDLRDEMSWDLAEKEVKAQQDSIDQQIDSLNDYKEYTENYYEYLFAHPKKLIEEMKEIMKGADDEIIAWLIANDEEYAEATEATKQQTEDSWREMLRDMRGELELFWDEVEEIIAGGDDYIINFLKENSAAYREAGQLQAEAYVDEWKKQLEDLRKAYEEVADGIEPYDYTYIAPAEGNGSGGGGGGGGGGGSTSANTKNTGLLSISDITGMSLENGNGPISKVQEWAEGKNAFYNLSAGDTIKKNATTTATGNSHLDAQINKELKKLTLPLVKFGTGGVAGSDGLAWVDDKERILTPYQTELFESLMSSLDSMSRRVSVPGMPFIGDVQDVSGSPMSFGDIIVNVETLDGDADYEELAQKVLDAVTEKMNRGSVVGGIRYAR